MDKIFDVVEIRTPGNGKYVVKTVCHSTNKLNADSISRMLSARCQDMTTQFFVWQRPTVASKFDAMKPETYDAYIASKEAI